MLSRSRFWFRVGVLPIQLDPPTREHETMIRSVMAQVPGLDKIIVVPYTKFALTIPSSLHLAALAGLAMRDLPNVEVDFGALEHPEPRLPRVGQLLSHLGNEGVLLHWFHDRH